LVAPPDNEALNPMISEFYVGDGAVTICPTVYVSPVQNGIGRAVEPSASPDRPDAAIAMP
jgi:hypothetical protein